MKEKILFITPVFDQGGTETYIINLCEYLKKNKFKVVVVSSGGIRNKQLSDFNIKNLIVKGLRKKTIACFLKNILAIRKILKNEDIQIIHSSSIYTLIIARMAVLTLFNKQIKTVYTMHGGPNKNVEGTSKLLLNNFVDKTIVLSKLTKEILIKNGVKNEKISVVYNGIKNKNRPLNTLKNSQIIITSCGRLTEQKGYEYLIKAIKNIELNNFQVWIIGEGELRKYLEEMIIKFNLTNKIKILGFKENVIEYLSKSDIFVLPSLWEQFPISILEAMMMKLPVVATNVNGIPEEIGDCGILVEAKNIEALKNEICNLIINSDKRKLLGEKAYKKFCNNFTIDNMGGSTIEVYNSIKK